MSKWLTSFYPLTALATLSAFRRRCSSSSTVHRLSRPIRSSSSPLSLLIRVNHARIRELYTVDGCAAEEYRLSAFPASIVLSADSYQTLESLSVAEFLFSKLVRVPPRQALPFFLSPYLRQPRYSREKETKREIIRFFSSFSSSFFCFVVFFFTPYFSNMTVYSIDHSLFRIDC